jgi:hypothetical protein
MIYMRKELIAPLSDVEAVVVECSNPICKAQVRVPVKANLVQRDTRIVPFKQCPVCFTDFDSTAREQVLILIQVANAPKTVSVLLNSEES